MTVIDGLRYLDGSGKARLNARLQREIDLWGYPQTILDDPESVVKLVKIAATHDAMEETAGLVAELNERWGVTHSRPRRRLRAVGDDE